MFYNTHPCSRSSHHSLRTTLGQSTAYASTLACLLLPMLQSSEPVCLPWSSECCRCRTLACSPFNSFIGILLTKKNKSYTLLFWHTDTLKGQAKQLNILFSLCDCHFVHTCMCACMHAAQCACVSVLCMCVRKSSSHLSS